MSNPFYRSCSSPQSTRVRIHCYLVLSLYLTVVTLCMFFHRHSFGAACALVSAQDYNDEYEEYEDTQPLNCTTAESITGGHVTYSQVN